MLKVSTIVCAAAICICATLCLGAEWPLDAGATVAVADFRCVGDVGITEAGKAAAELMRVELSRRGLKIVERTDLTWVSNERDLQIGRIVTPSQGGEQTTLVGIDYVVVGSVVSTGRLHVTARMVDVSNGVVVRTAMASANNTSAIGAVVAQTANALSGHCARRQGTGAAGSSGAVALGGENAWQGASERSISPMSAEQLSEHSELTVSQLRSRIRCLWAEVRMLQRCLGFEKLRAAMPGSSNPDELRNQLVHLEAEQAGLKLRMDAGEAVLITTPVRTAPVPAKLQREVKPQPVRVTYSKPVRYRRYASPPPAQISFASMRSSGRSSGRIVTVRRRRR